MKIVRIFPRRTRATPTDELAFIGNPGLFVPEADEYHVSGTFTWDKAECERLAHAWQTYGTVKLGGPVFNSLPGDFTPGMYLKPGYVITSRGCNNHCWFCDAWKREGVLRELPIAEGWNVLDNNLLQCSEKHIRDVFAMLKRQRHKAEFTGGLEAKLLQDWHIDLLLDMKPKQFFFAYDSEDDYEPLLEASSKLNKAGYTLHSHSHAMRCYVIVGFPRDTMDDAEIRLGQVLEMGFTPMAMLWKDVDGKAYSQKWSRFQREWARPGIIHSPAFGPTA